MKKQFVSALLLSLMTLEPAFAVRLGDRGSLRSSGRSGVNGSSASGASSSSPGRATTNINCEKGNKNEQAYISLAFLKNILGDNGATFKKDANGVITDLHLKSTVTRCLDLRSHSKQVDGKTVVHFTNVAVGSNREAGKNAEEKYFNCLRTEGIIDKSVSLDKQEINLEKVKAHKSYREGRFTTIPKPSGLSDTSTSAIYFESPKYSEYLLGDFSAKYKTSEFPNYQCSTVHLLEPGNLNYILMSDDFKNAKKIENLCSNEQYEEVLQMAKNLEKDNNIKGLRDVVNKAREEVANKILSDMSRVEEEMDDLDDSEVSEAREYGKRYLKLMEDYESLIINPNKLEIERLNAALKRGGISLDERDDIKDQIDKLSDQINDLHEKDQESGEVLALVKKFKSTFHIARNIRSISLRSKALGNYLRSEYRDGRKFKKEEDVSKFVRAGIKYFKDNDLKNSREEIAARKGSSAPLKRNKREITSRTKMVKKQLTAYKKKIKSKVKKACGGWMTRSKQIKCAKIRQRLPLYQERAARLIRNSKNYKQLARAKNQTGKLRGLYYDSKRRKLANSYDEFGNSSFDLSFIDDDQDLMDNGMSFARNDFRSSNDQQSFFRGNQRSQFNPYGSNQFSQFGGNQFNPNSMYSMNPQANYQMRMMGGAQQNPYGNTQQSFGSFPPYNGGAIMPGQQQFMTQPFRPFQVGI